MNDVRFGFIFCYSRYSPVRILACGGHRSLTTVIAFGDDRNGCLEKVSRRFDLDTVIIWIMGKPLRYKIIFDYRTQVKMTSSQLA